MRADEPERGHRHRRRRRGRSRSRSIDPGRARGHGAGQLAPGAPGRAGERRDGAARGVSLALRAASPGAARAGCPRCRRRRRRSRWRPWSRAAAGPGRRRSPARPAGRCRPRGPCGGRARRASSTRRAGPSAAPLAPRAMPSPATIDRDVRAARAADQEDEQRRPPAVAALEQPAEQRDRADRDRLVAGRRRRRTGS